ncbi:unnamed protein product [Macrosiphum euphorbiae]|uniref:Uncharacterized protein n=1 Tax=Macrosiphum euphorbiae TaxID=13131 RepID=A0AAV0WX13_9HEMI|nr:unnamed protein product [Macrosiphum euphorbiae]
MVACKVILAVAVVFMVVAVVQIQGRPSDITVHDMKITDEAWDNTFSKSMASIVPRAENAVLSNSMHEKTKTWKSDQFEESAKIEYV